MTRKKGIQSRSFPQGHVLLRDLKAEFPMISHGKGVYLYDQSGKKYLDASAGAMVVSLGHSQKEVLRDYASSLKKIAFASGAMFTSEVVEELAERLVHYGKKIGLDKAFFLSSGSEAIEAAVKFARQLCQIRGQDKKSKLIVRSPSYHGNTLYALSASGRPIYKKFFAPLLTDVLTLRTPLPHWDQALQRPFTTDQAVQEFEDLIQREGADSILAFLFEPIPGSSAGVTLAEKDYFPRMQEVCRQHGILMIADEIVTAVGRSGRFFACEHMNIQPDILVMAKGLGSGYVPISAVLVRSDHALEMQRSSGKFMHAQTFMNIPCTAAAGLAVIRFFEKKRLLNKVKKDSDYLEKSLKDGLLSDPLVGSINGRGFLWGIELVASKNPLLPFDRQLLVAEKWIKHLMKSGIIAWPNVGHVDGVRGDLVIVAPPLTISRNEIKEMVRRYQQSLASLSQELSELEVLSVSVLAGNSRKSMAVRGISK